MRIWLRFILPVLAVLAALSWGASAIVDVTSRRWFENDMRLRSQLAVGGARQGMVRCWKQGDTACVRRTLAEITRDERVMAAAACDPGLALIASTDDYPPSFDCALVAAVARDGDKWRPSYQTRRLATGTVHVSTIPLTDGADTLGLVVMVHDMRFVVDRAAETRHFTLLAFILMTALASAVTLVVARTSWRSWNLEMRRLLRGSAHRPEFRPLAADVRELIDRISSDFEQGGGGNAWTPGRLQSTLRRHLHGERLVVVANREPYVHERGADGSVRVLHPASGLVSALEPVMRACSGVWVAHGSGSADRDTADRDSRIWVPPGQDAYQIRRIWLTAEEEQGYYYGLANEGLWPLCHVAHHRPTFRSEDWRHYQRVNRKFADAACAEADRDDPIILVQDYHFALAPRMIRERRPRATILSFWHIPWPNAERFRICPWSDEILDGLLGSSIVGFHTQYHCNNFLETVERSLEARIDRELMGVVHGGRTTLVRPYPISIEWPNRWLADCPPAAECRKSIFTELGLRDDALLGVGVDRLDYTKGVEERVAAVERLLERNPDLRGRFTFVQLAAPSRTQIERYRDLNVAVERAAERVNARFGSGRYRPVIIRRAHHEPPTVFRYYRAADVCYVSSLHDGMNLVAKEFVAAREDEHGVLLLSQFTGAARELTEALIVNPYDFDQASSALATALRMSAAEQAERMRAMRSVVSHFNVYRWAGRMLADAAQLRQRERLAGRLTDGVTYLESAGG